MARKSLADWLNMAIAETGPGKEGGLRNLILHHKTDGGERLGEVVHKLSRGSGDWDVKKVCDVFDARAAMHIQEKHGWQVFRVLAFYGDNQDAHGDGFEFGRQPEADNVHGSTEGLGDKAREAQKMRHDEALGQRYMNALDSIMGRFQELNNTLARENRELREDNRGMFETTKSMALQMESHTHELLMKQMAFDRNSFFIKKGMEIAGPLLNTLTGRPVVPVSFADTQLIESIVLHMASSKEGTPGAEGMETLMKMLPTPIVVSLMARAQEIIEKKNKEAKDLADMNPFRDPGADAAGEMPGSRLPQNGQEPTFACQNPACSGYTIPMPGNQEGTCPACKSPLTRVG
jgi:hypothetical protein